MEEIAEYLKSQQKQKSKSNNDIHNKSKKIIAKFMRALEISGYKPVAEYKFSDKRNFRFDIALPDLKIAVEYEGGIFDNGRHTRGIGYATDCTKYNLATVEGWKILRYTAADKKKNNWEFLPVADVNAILGK